MSLALDLDTVMTILLIRFALIVAAVSVLVIIAFTILIVLKRGGQLAAVRRRVEAVVRNQLRAQRAAGPPTDRPTPGRRGVLSALDRITKGGGRT
ncbi:hypothetical protein OG735_31785 [Streptomyces sp. NBC_01210]|uniref:hypothetical protein n=1 Tax=Streptomyces sp. NBC_01210 TaxID=2903774 RepID=UPI002E15B9ED|nr:hypothetical protein OG735_31785 [Streptomyces sp. NBC_01210]